MPKLNGFYLSKDEFVQLGELYDTKFGQIGYLVLKLSLLKTKKPDLGISSWDKSRMGYPIWSSLISFDRLNELKQNYSIHI